jgi:ferredoxin-type protein NapH
MHATDRSAMKRQHVRRGILLGSFALFQSFRIVHLMFSPVLLLLAAARGVVGGSMLLYGALFASSLVLGRAFCGWVCPGCGLQELVALRVRRPMRSRRAGRVKWGIAAALFATAAVLAVRAGGPRSVDPLFGTRPASLLQGVLLLSGHLVIIAGLALALGRWASCHVVCWIAPLLVAGTRVSRAGGWPALHLEAEPGQCTRCGVCDDGCPMSLPVARMVESGAMGHDECLLCGTCVDGCPSNAVRFAFSRVPAGASSG